MFIINWRKYFVFIIINYGHQHVSEQSSNPANNILFNLQCNTLNGEYTQFLPQGVKKYDIYKKKEKKSKSDFSY